MPLGSFDTVKKKVLDEQFTHEDSLGTTITYIPNGGNSVTLNVHVFAEDNANVDFQTETEIDQLTVQFRKEDISKPGLHDKVVHEGKVYYNSGQMTDDGSAFWRIVFMREHVYTKGVSGGE